MKTTELRIGSFIKEIGQQELFRVWGIYHEKCNDKINLFPAALFEPVCISEEILLKFGFELDQYSKTIWTKDNGINTVRLSIDVFYSNFEADYDAIVSFKCPKYVHQLQNLYYCLTGEELTI